MTISVYWVAAAILFFIAGYAVKHLFALRVVKRVTENHESLLRNVHAEAMDKEVKQQSIIETLTKQANEAESEKEKLAAELVLAREDLVHMKDKSEHQQSAIDALTKELGGAEAALREVRTELDKSREELTVIAFPYEEEVGDDGWIVDDRRAEIGYKYQLFLKGVPCFEAHKIPFKTLHKKEVNPAKIKFVREEVLNLIEGVAKLHPAIRALNSESALPIGNRK